MTLDRMTPKLRDRIERADDVNEAIQKQKGPQVPAALESEAAKPLFCEIGRFDNGGPLLDIFAQIGVEFRWGHG